MLSAKRKSDGQTVTAYLESKSNGPFHCLECNEEVILKTGRVCVTHFAHANPIACKFQTGETDVHRRCKMEIYEALQREPAVRKAALERSLETVRPDVSAYINDVPVAIEVQISDLPLESIIYRTREYERKGIYVLWLLPWTRKLDAKRYSPRLWEKWVHATYFVPAYYWVKGLTVASYHFDSNFKSVPKRSWHSAKGEKLTGGGYSRRSRRYRTTVRGLSFNLVKDFVPTQRTCWQGNDFDAKMDDTKDRF